MQPSTPMIVVRPLLLEFFQPAQGTVDLVLGVLPHAARIQQDGVGLRGAIDRLVTRPQQLGGDQFAVQHVHLAADGLDIESPGHTLHSSRGTPGARIGNVFGTLGGAVVVLLPLGTVAKKEGVGVQLPPQRFCFATRAFLVFARGWGGSCTAGPACATSCRSDVQRVSGAVVRLDDRFQAGDVGRAEVLGVPLDFSPLPEAAAQTARLPSRIVSVRPPE